LPYLARYFPLRARMQLRPGLLPQIALQHAPLRPESAKQRRCVRHRYRCELDSPLRCAPGWPLRLRCRDAPVFLLRKSCGSLRPLSALLVSRWQMRRGRPAPISAVEKPHCERKKKTGVTSAQRRHHAAQTCQY
jgi:hypothetical protein